MAKTYPYTISNKQIGPFLAKIRSATKPERLSQQILRNWGFTASNDRALLRILKGLGFVNENGIPTEQYNRLKDGTDWKNVLGEQVRELYSDLFATDTQIHKAPDDEVKGAFSRITGQDDATVNRYFGTFKALAAQANLDGNTKKRAVQVEDVSGDQLESREHEQESNFTREPSEHRRSPHSFHYNIQIHLPATNDISVYNAIFKSVKDHLLD
ncbi:MAG: DUF5343 domain-containing protein [Pyrinomonadaceae bacterium]